MKAYYKILGVKKDASEEEIREHWVELMRKLHPDQRIEGKAEDERIKEINEAYQVLKHSSTRVEYDLKRAYDQRKRNSYLRRLSIPIAIFVVLVMIGTLYLRKSQITLQANLPTQNRTNPIDQTDPSAPPHIDASMDSRIDASTHQPTPTLTHPPAVESTHSRVIASSHPRIDATMPKLDEASKPTTQLPNNLMTKLPNDSITQLPNDPTSQQSVVASPHSRIDASTDQPKRSNVPNDTNDLNDPNVPHMAASTHERISASTPLIATEEEVRGFFGNYTERYTQRDLDSFISLFSSRAIQNRQDGLEGIRQIYGNFLKQSQEIKYDIDHIKIEIYQNGIEVKARYELVQMVKKSGDKRIWRGDIRWSLIKEDGALKILSLDYQHQKSP